MIVNFTPTGMIPTKAQTPYVPVTVNEVIEDVHRACELGITIVHLHARNQQTGEPDYRPEIYEQMILGIRRFAPELIVGVSLSGRKFKSFEERSAPLRLDHTAKPDMGSLTLSSLNFNRIESVNTPDMINYLALEMKRLAIMPELEVFDAGMINYAKYLSNKNIVRPPYYFNMILGNIACAQADLLHAGLMVRDLPPESFWSMGGIGDYQLPVNSMAMAAGGGVRVGLEDNIWLDRGRTRLATNFDLLKRIHLISESMERPVMSPLEARSLLGLQRPEIGYGLNEDRFLDEEVKTFASLQQAAASHALNQPH